MGNIFFSSSSSSDSLSNSSDYVSDSSAASSASALRSLGLLSVDYELAAEQKKKTLNATWREEIKDKIEAQQNAVKEINIKEVVASSGLSLDDFVTALGDAQMFKETFLKPKFNFQNLIDEINEEMEQRNLVGFDHIETKKAIERLEQRKIKMCTYRLKLLLTTCSASRSVLFRIPAILLGFKFGALHSALSVNGVVLEWGRGMCGPSLICPTIDLNGLLVAIDIQEKDNGIWNSIKSFFTDALSKLLSTIGLERITGWYVAKLLEDQLDTIANTCVAYNRVKYYNVSEGNCQNFVSDVCRHAKIKLEYEGQLGKVINKIIINGRCDFEFNGVSFVTRAELDSFVMNLNFTELSKSDQQLLFSYCSIFDNYAKLAPNEHKYATSEQAKKHWEKLLVAFKFVDE